MIHKERVVHGNVRSAHIVQFFDSVASLADGVSGFLADSFHRGDRLLVIAAPRNWGAIADRMRSRECSVSEGVAAGRIAVLDAQTTLGHFMQAGLPDSVLFHEMMGAMVGDLASRKDPAGLTIYGEMVELLAEEGNFYGAQRLEELWNELAIRHSFELLCGYSAAHFASRDAQAALASICHTHSHVHRSTSDPLAEWILRSEPKAIDRSLLSAP